MTAIENEVKETKVGAWRKKQFIVPITGVIKFLFRFFDSILNNKTR